MAKTYAWLFGSGATLVALTLALPGDPARVDTPILVACAVAYLTTGLVLLGYDRLPLHFFLLLPVLGSVLITCVVYFGGAGVVNAYAVLYFWVVLSTASLFSPRWVVFNVLLSTAGFGAVLAIRGAGELEVRVLMVMGGLLVAGVVFSALRGRVEVLIDELERRARKQDVVADLGRRALAGETVPSLMQRASDAVCDALGVERAAVFQSLADERRLVLQSGSGWPRGMINRAAVPDLDPLVGAAMNEEAVAIPDLLHEPGLLHGLLLDPSIASGLAVPIRADGESWGVLAVYSSSSDLLRDSVVSFVQAVANVLADAVQRRNVDQKMRHQAMHDPLTGRPNRALFQERVNEALIRCNRIGSGIAIFFVDIDDFKLINDGLGHRAGDQMLIELAPRLREALYMQDTVARFGGDEFAVLCEDVTDAGVAKRIAEDLLRSLEAPFEINGRTIRTSASIGVAMSDAESGEGAETLIAQADAAMYRAKDRRPGGYEVFDAGLRQWLRNRLDFQHALRDAVPHGELRLVYQRMVSLDDGSTYGCEALLRWTHPQLGQVSPLDFIPAAEESGAIVPIGEWVIAHTCRAVASWRSLYGDAAPLPIHCNVSGRQLSEAGFVAMVKRNLADCRIRPGEVVFEITEHALIGDAEATAEILDQLRDLGIAIVLDDFGTGFSSLSYLKQFPIDAVKVDRMFVAHVTDEPKDAAIVASVIGIADAFGIDVIAEGIETPDQIARLQELGCALGQGFHYGKPAPSDEFLRSALPEAEAPAEQASRVYSGGTTPVALSASTLSE